MKKLLILGAGGFGKTIADLAQQLGCYEQIAFLDDGRSGAGILGKCSEFSAIVDDMTEIYPAFGSNVIRMNWLQILKDAGVQVATLIHPRAYVSPTAAVSAGVAVLPLAIVNTGVSLCEGCIINCGAIVDHDCVVEKAAHLAPGAIVKAENRIPAGMKVESGTVVENREYPL